MSITQGKPKRWRETRGRGREYKCTYTNYFIYQRVGNFVEKYCQFFKYKIISVVYCIGMTYTCIHIAVPVHKEVTL